MSLVFCVASLQKRRILESAGPSEVIGLQIVQKGENKEMARPGLNWEVAPGLTRGHHVPVGVAMPPIS